MTIEPVTLPKPKADHPNAGLRRREAVIGLLFLSPWILGFILLKLLPILWTLGYSFTDFSMLNPEDATFVGLKNYIDFLTDINALSGLVGSLGYFISTVTLELLVALGLAAILSSHCVRVKAFLASGDLPAQHHPCSGYLFRLAWLCQPKLRLAEPSNYDAVGASTSRPGGFWKCPFSDDNYGTLEHWSWFPNHIWGHAKC